MEKFEETFLRVLDPEDTSTGGGSASALAGAMAGALLAMVARLSIGETNSHPEDFYIKISRQGEELSRALLDGGNQDSQAFAAVRKSYKLPKENSEEKDRRRQAIHNAWIRATQVPLNNAEQCARLIELIRQLRPHANRTAASDLECAFLLAQAALFGCLENVQINLPFIKDQNILEEFTQRSQALKTL